MSWGGIRKGAGRPKQVEIRKNKSIRVFDEEWEIIKPVINLIKKIIRLVVICSIKIRSIKKSW